MSKILAFFLVMTLTPRAMGQTVIAGDAWVLGKVGVGTDTPGARVEVVSGSSATFQVSGVDGTPFLTVEQDGKFGLSTTPIARLDISGVADSADAGLQVEAGNLYPGTTNRQITFGYDGSMNYRHAIQSTHQNSVSTNSIDFLVWEPSGSKAASDPANLVVTSLVIHSTGASVHIRPIGYADTDLVVSDGSTPGGGTVHCAAQVSPSLRGLKSDISYLGRAEEEQALDELANVKLASFRYKRLKGKKLVRDRKKPLKRGMIYEEAPASVRRPGGFVSLDGRITNAELALKELMRRLEDTAVQAKRLEAAP
jgi:hypothetical protein